MLLKTPRVNERIFWTKHSKEKMRQYRLSENRLKRVLRFPERKETGIAPETIAVMQSTGRKKRPTEIWLMYQIVNQKSNLKNQKSLPVGRQEKIKIISAWRYPGRSPIREAPPIPEDILQELNRIIKKSAK